MTDHTAPTRSRARRGAWLRAPRLLRSLGVTHGSATNGYLGVIATDDTTADPRMTCTPTPPHTFSLGSDTTVSCIATDEAGLSKTKTFVVHVNVIPGTRCALTKTYVEGSAKYGALSLAQKAVVDRLVTLACDAVGRLAGRLTPTQKQPLSRRTRKVVGDLAAQGSLTIAQATRPSALPMTAFGSAHRLLECEENSDRVEGFHV